VCDDLFDDTAAGVVCRQLGLGSTGQAVKNAAFGAANASTPILLDNVACRGEEYKLEQCPSNGFGNSAGCSHQEDVGVVCFGEVAVDAVLPQVGKLQWRVSLCFQA